MAVDVKKIIFRPKTADDKLKIERIEWKAPEYEFHPKSPDWFWAVGIISFSLFVSAIFLRSFLFAILVLFGGFAVALYGAKKPEIISFSIGPRGIEIGERIYDYENLKSFWINYDPPDKKELLLESKKTFMPRISIILGDADPIKLRNYLIKFIKEEKIEESLINTIARVLRF